jgi:hypothetical protein
MSSGNRVVTYYTEETTIGETPAIPTWETLRFTENAMTPTVNTSASDEIRADRMRGNSTIDSIDYSGDIGVEFSAGTFDTLLAGAFYSDWVADELTIGTTEKSFTFVKGYADVNTWHTFTGVHIGTLSLDVPEEGKITMTFGTMGMGYEDATTDPTSGDTINPATTTVALGSGTGVGEVLVDGVSLAGSACISALTLELDNTIQTQRCLGKVGPGALRATTAAVTGTVTMAWSSAALTQWQKTFTRESIAIVLPLEDSAGNSYTLTLPEVEIDGDLPTGSLEDIIQVELNYTARNTPISITRSLV